MASGGGFIGAATNGFPAPLRGGYGRFRDRRDYWNEGRDGQDSPFSGGAVRATRIGGRNMNQHLSRDQISRCVIGDGTPQEKEHVSQCGACRSEVARLESSFAQFRGAVRGWSDHVGNRNIVREASNMNYENHLERLLVP